MNLGPELRSGENKVKPLKPFRAMYYSNCLSQNVASEAETTENVQ